MVILLLNRFKLGGAASVDGKSADIIYFNILLLGICSVITDCLQSWKREDIIIIFIGGVLWLTVTVTTSTPTRIIKNPLTTTLPGFVLLLLLLLFSFPSTQVLLVLMNDGFVNSHRGERINKERLKPNNMKLHFLQTRVS